MARIFADLFLILFAPDLFAGGLVILVVDDAKIWYNQGLRESDYFWLVISIWLRKRRWEMRGGYNWAYNRERQRWEFLISSQFRIPDF